MRLTLLILLFLFNGCIYSQSIVYINVDQKIDVTGLVEINYTINGNPDYYSIGLQISFDASITFTNIPYDYLDGNYQT